MTSIPNVPISQRDQVPSTIPRRGLKWFYATIIGLWIVIAIVRYPILVAPAYYDFALGIFTEARFLQDSGFDYFALASQPHAMEPEQGARGYVVTVLSGFITLLFLLFDSIPVAIAIFHIFIFLCSAVVLGTVLRVLRERHGLFVAASATAALAFSPLFSAQMDLTSMDMPVAAAAVVSAFALQKGNWRAAAFSAMVAFLFKESAVVFVGSLGIVAGSGLLVSWITHDRDSRRFYLSLTLSVAFVAIVCRLLMIASQTMSSMVRLGTKLPMLLIWCPDLILLALAVVLLVITRAVIPSLRRQEDSRATSTIEPRGLLELWRTHRFDLLGFVYIGSMVAALTFVPFLPRYLTSCVPFLYVMFADQWASVSRSRAFSASILSLIALVNAVNWDGRLFRDPWRFNETMHGISPEGIHHESSFLERSREFLADHASQQEAVRVLVEQGHGDPIVAGNPFQMYIDDARFGYVKSPLRGYSLTGYGDSAPWFGTIDDLVNDAPKRVVFVDIENTFTRYRARFRLLTDEELKEPNVYILYRSRDKHPILVYRVDLSLLTEEQRREWYRERVWPGGTIGPLLAWHLASGDVCRAIEQCERWEAYRPGGLSYLLRAALARKENDPKAISSDLLRWAFVEESPSLSRALPHEAALPDQAEGHQRTLHNELNRLVKKKDGYWQAALFCLRLGAIDQAKQYLVAYAVDDDVSLRSTLQNVLRVP